MASAAASTWSVAWAVVKSRHPAGAREPAKIAAAERVAARKDSVQQLGGDAVEPHLRRPRRRHRRGEATALHRFVLLELGQRRSVAAIPTIVSFPIATLSQSADRVVNFDALSPVPPSKGSRAVCCETQYIYIYMY